MQLLFNGANRYQGLNRLDDAELMIKEALQIKKHLLGHNSLDVASLLHSLSTLHLKQNRPSDAEAALKEAMRIQEVKRGHDSEEVARALNSLGSLYEANGLLEAAEPM